MKNRAYQVRARQTFVEKSTFSEMNDRVVANLLYRTKANDLLHPFGFAGALGISGVGVRTDWPRMFDADLALLQR